MKLTPKKNGLAAYLRSHEHPGGIIVSEQQKFIYMKPAKTAGTSILRAGLETRDIGIFHYKDHPEQYKEWINRITDEDLEDYFIFSVIRNPWDRLASVATYFKVPLKELIQNIDEYWKNEQIRIHSLPLFLYTHCNGELFVDFLCRFECLQSDMNLVFDRLGIKREKLPHVNRSKHDHYSMYYTDTEINKVEAMYKQDIEYFGYMFEPASLPRPNMISMVTQYLYGITKRSSRHS